MFKKIILGLRIALPFIINVLLYLWIYDLNKDTNFGLMNTLFYVGIINLFYGLGALFFVPNIISTKSSALNLAFGDQNDKKYYQGEYIGFSIKSIISTYLKLIYIILGVGLCIAAIIVYII